MLPPTDNYNNPDHCHAAADAQLTTTPTPHTIQVMNTTQVLSLSVVTHSPAARYAAASTLTEAARSLMDQGVPCSVSLATGDDIDPPQPISDTTIADALVEAARGSGGFVNSRHTEIECEIGPLVDAVRYLLSAQQPDA